jgi:hypothetical protein
MTYIITEAEVKERERVLRDQTETSACILHCICGRFQTKDSDCMAEHIRTEHRAAYGLTGR